MSTPAPAPTPPDRLSMSGASGSTRYAAPDVARGFMLLLIAIANVYWWYPFVTPEAAADQWWVVIRTALIDQRSYPLFALLFGYGLALIAIRRSDAGAPEPTVRRLLRRRGWWMLAIAVVHAVFFGGDIIGTYAVIALVVAGLVAGNRMRVLTVLAVVTWLLAFVVAGLARLLETQFEGAPAGFEMPEPGSSDPGWLMFNVVHWAVNTPLSLVSSMVVPAAVIGVWIARTTLLSEPGKHLPLLWGTAVGGLLVSAGGGFVTGLHRSGISDGTAPVWATSLNAATMLIGALAWLAVAGLLGAAVQSRIAHTGRAPAPFSPAGILMAVGRRSMTAYLLQTVLFLGIIVALRLLGVHENLTSIGVALVAVAVYTVIALLCAAMALREGQGPAEWLLRVLVARSASEFDKAALSGRPLGPPVGPPHGIPSDGPHGTPSDGPLSPPSDGPLGPPRGQPPMHGPEDRRTLDAGQ